MIQEIIVAIIGVVVCLILLYKVYGFFFDDTKSKGACGCSNCQCNNEKKRKNI